MSEKSYLVHVIGGVGCVTVIDPAKKKVNVYELSKKKSEKIEEFFKEIKEKSNKRT